jgi:hypothetical protein
VVTAQAEAAMLKQVYREIGNVIAKGQLEAEVVTHLGGGFGQKAIH